METTEECKKASRKIMERKEQRRRKEELTKTSKMIHFFNHCLFRTLISVWFYYLDIDSVAQKIKKFVLLWNTYTSYIYNSVWSIKHSSKQWLCLRKNSTLHHILLAKYEIIILCFFWNLIFVEVWCNVLEFWNDNLVHTGDSRSGSQVSVKSAASVRSKIPLWFSPVWHHSLAQSPSVLLI